MISSEIRRLRQVVIIASIIFFALLALPLALYIQHRQLAYGLLGLLAGLVLLAHWGGYQLAKRTKNTTLAQILITIVLTAATVGPVFLFSDYWLFAILMAVFMIAETGLSSRATLVPIFAALSMLILAGALAADIWLAPVDRLELLSEQQAPIVLSAAGLITLIVAVVGFIIWRTQLRDLRLNLSSQLLLVFSALAAGSILAVMAVIIWQIRNDQVAQVGRSFQSLGEFQSERAGNTFEQQIGLLKNLWYERTIIAALNTANVTYGFAANRPETWEALRQKDVSEWQTAADNSELVRSYILNEPAQALARFIVSNPNHKLVLVTDKVGALVAATKRTDHLFYRDETWWQTAWNNGAGSIYIGDLTFDPDTQEATVLIAAYMKDPQTKGEAASAEAGQTVGVIATVYSLNVIQSSFKSLTLEASDNVRGQALSSGSVELLSQNGIVIASSRTAAGGTTWASLANSGMLSQSNSGWDFIDDANKRRSILAHAPLRTTSGENLAPLTALAWQVVAYDTESSALANVTQSMKTASLVGVLAIAVIIIIAAETARRLTKPIDDLTMAAEAITAGDLSRRANPSGVIEMLTLANAFNSLTSRLQQSLSGLEHRVAERTRDLEKRSLQIQAASEVGRAAASILDVNELLQNTVELIRERFELYYTGIFMADANNEWAVLRAGTGEAGKAMLARRHRIKIGEGMIGWCIKNAQARIAEEARLDTVRKVNPDLPNTRSEAALPLRSRNKVLGAISVQSEQVNAFDEATLIVLQTMADQVAVALENARLFAESNEALEATRRAYGELSREAWTRLLGNQANQGYRVDESGLTPLVGAPTVEAGDTELPAPAAQAGQAQPGKSVREVSVPVEVRGQRLGTLTAHKHETAGAWTEEEETLLKALVEQLNVALDNARLYTDTQRRAERERILANITAKVRASANVDTILQTALQEVAASLSVTKGTILLKRTEKDEPLKSEAPAEPGGGKTND